MYCAELMVNMKDVPSTERMVLCSKQWKMMTQKEKDMFQKRCEQVWQNSPLLLFKPKKEKENMKSWCKIIVIWKSFCGWPLMDNPDL